MWCWYNLSPSRTVSSLDPLDQNLNFERNFCSTTVLRILDDILASSFTHFDKFVLNFASQMIKEILGGLKLSMGLQICFMPLDGQECEHAQQLVQQQGIP